MTFKRDTGIVAPIIHNQPAVIESLEGRRLFSAAVVSAAQAATPLITAAASTQQPSVTTVSPAANATGVDLNSPVTANVSLPNGRLDSSTVNGSTVTLVQTSNSTAIPAVVNTTGGGDAIILTPSSPLAANTSYTLTITSGVKDVTGASLVAFTESFTTGTVGSQLDQTIAFQKVPLPTAQGENFTCVRIGPDGRLYASTEDGRIFRYVINSDGTLSLPQVITSLQTAEGGNRLITGFAFDSASTASNPIIWVSNTFYALSGATNGPDFTGKITVMSGQDLGNIADAVIGLPRSVADHVNDQPIFGPGPIAGHTYLYFTQAGNNAYGAPDTTWGNRSEHLLTAAILRLDTSALTLSSGPLNVITPDAGGNYNPFAAGAPLTIYATGIRNAFSLLFDDQGTLWAPVNGSSSGGNSPAFNSSNPQQINGNRIDTGAPYAGPNVPGLTNIQETETDVLDKIVQGGYYGHPNPVRGEYVLDDGNPTTGAYAPTVFTEYPSGTNPDVNYRLPNFNFGDHRSPDGIIEYTGNAFGGALNGKILVAEYSAGTDIAVLSRDASDNIAATAVNRSISGLSGFANPVDLVEDPATGNIYVSELGGGRLTLLRPSAVAPQISSDKSVVAFNTIATGNAGAGPSRIQTVTITNTGTDALTFAAGAISIVNDPASATQDAGDFAISGSLPTSLAAGQSATIQLKYTATVVGVQNALLQINSNDPATPTLDINLHGIGTAGQFGYNEPSLVQILRANNIPTIVGAGANDINASNPTYPETPDASSQEVQMQRLEVAGPGPVTITPLASFNSSVQPSVRFGYYTPGDPTSANELFTISQADSQTVYPTAQGSTSFKPGTSPFGLFSTFPGTTTPNGSLDIHYSEDALNTLDPTHPRKLRFFPLENADGSVVANAYIVAAEDYNNPTYNSFVNFVGIIRNVMPAPNAANAPVFGLQNLDGVPSDSQMVFNRIQIPNPTVADIVHDTGQLQINNTGSQPLVINSVTLSDTTNWMVVNPLGPGTAIAPGGSLLVTVKFIATTDPAHSDNQTNDTATTNGVSVQAAGGVWNGNLVISTNDPVNPSRTVNLAGYWQYQTEHENEPGLQTIVNRLFGYGTNISNTFQPNYPNPGNKITYYGEEVASGLWNVADPSSPVSVRQLDAFHNQYDSTTNPPITPTASFGWYLQNNSKTNYIFTDHANESQSLLPTMKNSLTTPAAGSFKPTGTFGLNLDGEKTQDNLNTVDINTYHRTGHAVRIWPLRDSQGNIVPNSWIVALDYQNGPYDNYDYQDIVYLVSNMTPAGHPATPTDVQAATGSTGTLVQWAPVTGATGYNVYRSSSGGAFTKITASPVTTSVFTDLSAPAGAAVKYQVTAVNSSRVESIPANSSINLVGAPNAQASNAPAAPTALTADGTSGTQVVLNWTGSTGATSYLVEREDPGSSTFSQIASNITSSTYTDANVTPGATYQYRIRAQNSVGISAYSTLASATVTPTSSAPSAPASLGADGTSGTQVVLNWTASTGATSYLVEREDPGSSTFVQIASNVTLPTYTDSSVTQGATYQYRVRAQNSVGLSPYSNIASAAVIASQNVPSVPTNLQADASSGTQVVLSWGASTGAATYHVERQAASDSTFSEIAGTVTGTTFTDTSVVAGTSYQYRVRAENATGFSSYSNSASADLVPAGATLDVTVGKGANKLVQFTTTNGTLVTVKLNGAGSATVHFSADTISQTTSKRGVTISGTNVSIASITTTATNQSSTLNIITKGGNGIVNLGAISADGSLNSIVAKSGTLIGRLSAVGSINKITLGASNAGAVNIGGTLGSLQVATVNGLNLTSAGLVKNLSATHWTSSGTLTAPVFGAIKIKGDATFVLNAGSVHSIRVGGNLHDSTLTLSLGGALDLGSLSAGSLTNTFVNATGNLGSISASTLLNSQIDAGIIALPSGQFLPASASDFAAQSSIASVNLKKLKGVASDVNSSIAAATINRVSLGTVQFANNATPFGVSAIDLNSLTAVDPSTGRSFTFKKLTNPAMVTADFAAKAINPQDFVVKIL